MIMLDIAMPEHGCKYCKLRRGDDCSITGTFVGGCHVQNETRSCDCPIKCNAYDIMEEVAKCLEDSDYKDSHEYVYGIDKALSILCSKLR